MIGQSTGISDVYSLRFNSWSKLNDFKIGKVNYCLTIESIDVLGYFYMNWP